MGGCDVAGSGRSHAARLCLGAAGMSRGRSLYRRYQALPLRVVDSPASIVTLWSLLIVPLITPDLSALVILSLNWSAAGMFALSGHPVVAVCVAVFPLPSLLCGSLAYRLCPFSHPCDVHSRPHDWKRIRKSQAFQHLQRVWRVSS